MIKGRRRQRADRGSTWFQPDSEPIAVPGVTVDEVLGSLHVPDAEVGSPTSRSVFREPGFRQLWLAATSTAFGSQIAVLAIPTVAILSVHASSAQVGALFAIGYIGPPLVGLFAGALADRYSRKRIMLLTTILRVFLMGSVPLAWALGHISLLQLYAVAFAVGAASTFYDIAAQASLPTLVPRDRLADGNAQLAVGRSASQIAGPSAAGALIQLVGAPATFVADALAHGLACLAVWRMPVKPSDERARSQSRFMHDVRDGLSFVWRQRPLRQVAIATAVLNLGGAAIAATFYLFVYRTLKLSPGWAGAIASVGNVGIMLGAFATPRLVRRFGAWPVIRVSLMNAALATWLIPVATFGLPIVVLAIYELLFALLSVTFAIAQVSWRQAATPPAYQARTSAFMRSAMLGTLPIGALIGGVVASQVGVTASIIVGAAIGTAGAAWLLSRREIALMPSDPSWV